MMIAKMLSRGRFLAVCGAALAASGETGRQLFSDDFSHGLSRWRVERERPGVVEAKGGILTMDVPAGCTVWLRRELRGPVEIQYEATMIRRGGVNDRVSDLNCFWMASDARVKRSGKFADYNTLRGYYVGQGGNGNTTTRFRRYIGDPELRPLLPEHDLKAPLLEANVPVKIRLVADGARIQYWCDGKLVFDFRDAAPYRRGWFGFRTTFSHVEVRKFRVMRAVD